MRPYVYPDGSKKVLRVVDMGRNVYYHGDIRSDRRWDIESKATKRNQKSSNKKYCAFCQSELASNRHIWSSLLRSDDHITEYVTKYLCCMNKDCPTRTDPTLRPLDDSETVIPTMVVMPPEKFNMESLPSYTPVKVEDLSPVDMGKAAILSILAKPMKTNKKINEIIN